MICKKTRPHINVNGGCMLPDGGRCSEIMYPCDCCGKRFFPDKLGEVEYKKDGLPAVVCEDCSYDEDIFRRDDE